MTEIEKQALEVYTSWKKYVNYKDDSKMRAIRQIIQRLMDGIPHTELLSAGLNYKKEHKHRPEKYLLSAANFFSMHGKTGEPEWMLYAPENYEKYSTPVQEPPESPVSDSKPETTSAPRMTFETFMRHSGKAAEQVRQKGDE